MTVTVRPARASDANALAVLAAITFPLACPPHTTEASKRAFIAQHLSRTSFDGYLADPERRLFVAESDGPLLGYTMLVAGEPSDADVAAAVATRPTIELSKCYVHPDAHGGGIAAELMRASLAAAGLPGALIASRAKGVPEDDHLDALAALVVARDMSLGRAEPLPDPPERDAFGLPAVIWAPAPRPPS